MHDRPGPPQLLAMVAAFLRDSVVPTLDPANAYQARIAANVLDIASRQIAHSEENTAVERASLQSLLGTQDGDLASLNRTFATMLQDGELDGGDPKVRRHLWQTTMAKLAVDQPKYPRFVQTLGKD